MPKTKYNIDFLKKFAKDKNGECLSNKYLGYHKKHLWRCQCGHEWEATVANIFSRESWCPVCAQKIVAQKLRKYTIKDAQKLAKNNRGECLSKKFISTHHKLEWKCSKNHIWTTSFYSLQKGHWCPYCAPNSPITFSDIQKLAEKRKGKCLSKKYVNNNTKLKWECSEGHVFKMSYGKVQQGQWCLECHIINSKKYNLGYARYLAKQNNGSCLYKENLDDSYKIKLTEKMKWECSNKHIWFCEFRNVLNGFWCKKCFNNGRKLSLKNMQELAKNQHGKCLSKEYINAKTRLKWECSEGHVFLQTPTKVKNNKIWCPYCKNKSEQRFREIIEEILHTKFPKKKPKWLVNENRNRLELDGYNEDLKIAFEYQGIQHFQKVSYFGDTEKKFEKRQKHDEIKRELCKSKNILLICPTYDLKEDDYKEFILKNIPNINELV
jgi:hypothetical protein